MRKSALLTVFLFLGIFSHKSSGQLNQMGRILTGGIDDAEKIAEAYLTPFTNAFGATLNSGWYNTAKPHRVLGFDLTMSVNLAIIPDQAKSFSPGELGLGRNVTFSGPETSPTIAGETGVQRTQLHYAVGGNSLAEFTLPEGTGLGFIPTPTLQLGIGIPLETEIIGRYIPRTGLGDVGSFGLWGIGVKHSLKQWIPGINRLPVINLSVMGGYTKFYTSSDLSFIPSDIGVTDDNTSDQVTFDNQKLDFGVGSFTANVIASADIPFITGYIGLGINSTSTSLKMLGWYPIPELNPDTNQPRITDDSVIKKDPVDFKLSGDTGGIQPRATAGFKIKLAVLHIHFDYTYANYSVVTGGIGISFR